MKENSMGTHILLEVFDVHQSKINDIKSLKESIIHGIHRSKMTILNVFEHEFSPQGYTVLICLAESHVSCHTWPEKNSLAVDIYTCGEKNPRIIAVKLLEFLNSENYHIRELNR